MEPPSQACHPGKELEQPMAKTFGLSILEFFQYPQLDIFRIFLLNLSNVKQILNWKSQNMIWTYHKNEHENKIVNLLSWKRSRMMIQRYLKDKRRDNESI